MTGLGRHPTGDPAVEPVLGHVGPEAVHSEGGPRVAGRMLDGVQAFGRVDAVAGQVIEPVPADNQFRQPVQ